MNKLKSHKGKCSLEPAFLRSICPITNALDFLGDKWSLIIIRDLILGKRTYGDFLSSPEGIPTNILAERLKRLLANGIITKQAYQDKPVRYIYILSKKGEDLAPILEAIALWGLKYIKGTEAKHIKKLSKKNTG